jgi:LysM repeat protein
MLGFTLLLGAFLLPTERAHAGLIANLFSNKASADSIEIISPSSPSNNSQNLSLLESTVSSASLVDKDDAGDAEGVIQPDKNVAITDNALVPATGPLGIAGEVEAETPSSDQISIYVVREGDSLASIAKMFGVTTNTILWSNDMKKGDKLVTGDTLTILPVNGLKHTVAKGQTIQSIAKLYSVNASDIADFNEIDLGDKLAIGDELIIPGAELKPIAGASVRIKKTTGKVGSMPNNFGSADNATSVSGYYIKPIPCPLSQGKHDRYAVDMSCHGSGTPIKAAASGKVLLARMGYNGGFGNLIIIAHPNGTQTFYAHQSRFADGISAGDQVSQGQVIGYVGSTGRSTGPHLHFEVRGAKNPGFDNSWK